MTHVKILEILQTQTVSKLHTCHSLNVKVIFSKNNGTNLH